MNQPKDTASDVFGVAADAVTLTASQIERSTIVAETGVPSARCAPLIINARKIIKKYLPPRPWIAL